MIIVPLSIFLSVSGGVVENKTAEIITASVSKTKEVIRVFATPDNNNSITIQSANEAALSFYLFDVEGRLIHQSIINKSEKILLEGLTKGTYLYSAFQNDEKLKGGKISLP